MLYGRDSERAVIGELLEGARESCSGVLVIRGEPGIGKTALLLDARERATDMHVLGARGIESESELPFAALHQLMRPALEHLDQLSPPQATALRGALGLEESNNQERFLIFAACLSLLSELAERRPVLCIVDDAQWLDQASAEALLFVARRLEVEGIVMLFGAREGDTRRFEAGDLPSLVLTGLRLEAATALVERRVDEAIDERVLKRLVAQAEGNPLALIELPSALTPNQLAGADPLPATLPLTQHVETIFLGRVRQLSEEAQRLLLIAAADDSEELAVILAAASTLGVDETAIDEAERSELLLIREARAGFSHPLVRSAVYGAATSSERRAAHAALADTLADADEHADRYAWHLAASALKADEHAVKALEQAAARAGHRAGHLAAAQALERAAELSDDGLARGRRLAAAAQAAALAGAFDRAVALARRADPLLEGPEPQAELARVFGLAEISSGRPGDAVPVLLSAARQVAAVDQRKALELLLISSWATSDAADIAGQSEAAALAASLTTADERSAFIVDVLAGARAVGAGDASQALPQLERALAWAADAEDELDVYVGSACAFLLGDDHRTAALARRAVALARARGSFGVLCGALCLHASHHFVAQDFDEAQIAAEEGLRIARDLGAENLKLYLWTTQAGVAAVRGEEETARRLAGEVLDAATARGLPLRVAGAQRALALLELGFGHWTDALRHLDAASDVVPEHVNAFLAIVSAPDRVEASARAGTHDPTKGFEAFESWVVRSDAPWAKPRLAACRALLATGEEASGHFQEALRLGSLARPFDLARIRLLFGEHLRRERRRIDAREQLRAALATFERLRAESWAERTRTELRATGETARKRDPSTRGQLTPQELQIARLVADGFSNKEVAAQLFLSPRTIDAHLRNVFQKLEITSRTQLARMPLGDEDVSATRAAATV